MRKKDILGNILTEELNRFNQIGSYVNEQFLGLGSSNTSLLEQEPTEDEEVVDDESEDAAALADFPSGDETTDETGNETGNKTGDETGDELVGDDTGDTTEDVSDSNTEELEVTDIVNMTKETGDKTDELETTIQKQSDNLNSLIDKLDDLESKLNNMDKIVSVVDNLEAKFDEYRPQTPVEKLELRYLDSGPFSQSPKDYWEEKGDKLKKQKDKHEYVLNGEEVSDYSEGDIKNSWVYSPEDE